MGGKYIQVAIFLCVAILVVRGVPIDKRDGNDGDSERCAAAKAFVEEGKLLFIEFLENDKIPQQLKMGAPPVARVEQLLDYQFKPIACMVADAKYVEDLDEATGGRTDVLMMYSMIMIELKSIAGSVPQFFENVRGAFLEVSEFLKEHGYPDLPLQSSTDSPEIFFEGLQNSFGQHWLNYVLLNPRLFSGKLNEEELSQISDIIMGAENIQEMAFALGDLYQGPAMDHMGYSIHSYLEFQKFAMDPEFGEWFRDAMDLAIRGINMAQKYGLFDLQEREPLPLSTEAAWM